MCVSFPMGFSIKRGSRRSLTNRQILMGFSGLCGWTFHLRERCDRSRDNSESTYNLRAHIPACSQERISETCDFSYLGKGCGICHYKTSHRVFAMKTTSEGSSPRTNQVRCDTQSLKLGTIALRFVNPQSY